MKNAFKRIGRYLATLGPVAIALALNIFISVVMSICCGIVLGVQLGMSGEMATITEAEMNNRLMEMVMQYSMPVTIIFQILNFIIFGLWYKLWGHHKFANPFKVVKGSAVGVALFAALSLELLIGVAMTITMVFFPEVMQSYLELMEIAGVGQMNVMSFLATVILAPITEELIFRGVTMRLTKWAGMPFIIANILQAVLFGIFHMNLVQGAYATVIGLVLGYLGHRYKTLWVPILLHLFCNLYATVMGIFTIPDTIAVYVIMTVLGVLFAVLAVVIMKKENSKVAAEAAAPAEIN